MTNLATHTNQDIVAELDRARKALEFLKNAQRQFVSGQSEKETTLELYTLMKNDDACGPIIDDVSVTEDD